MHPEHLHFASFPQFAQLPVDDILYRPGEFDVVWIVERDGRVMDMSRIRREGNIWEVCLVVVGPTQ